MSILDTYYTGGVTPSSALGLSSLTGQGFDPTYQAQLQQARPMYGGRIQPVRGHSGGGSAPPQQEQQQNDASQTLKSVGQGLDKTSDIIKQYQQQQEDKRLVDAQQNELVNSDIWKSYSSALQSSQPQQQPSGTASSALAQAPMDNSPDGQSSTALAATAPQEQQQVQQQPQATQQQAPPPEATTPSDASAAKQGDIAAASRVSQSYTGYQATPTGSQSGQMAANQGMAASEQNAGTLAALLGYI